MRVHRTDKHVCVGEAKRISQGSSKVRSPVCRWLSLHLRYVQTNQPQHSSVAQVSITLSETNGMYQNLQLLHMTPPALRSPAAVHLLAKLLERVAAKGLLHPQFARAFFDALLLFLAQHLPPRAALKRQIRCGVHI